MIEKGAFYRPFSSAFFSPSCSEEILEWEGSWNRGSWIYGSGRSWEEAMAILYALVARGSVVLAEFSGAVKSNTGTVARLVLERIPGNEDCHLSRSQDRYIFHVERADGITVLCVADDSTGRRIPFAFLEDIHARFAKTYGRACHTALAYGMNNEFSQILSQQMEYYSNDPNADRMNRIRGEMHQVQDVMMGNINKLLEGGDRLELLADKMKNMQTNTHRFRIQHQHFRNTVWWRNIKLRILLFLLLLVIVYNVLGFVRQVVSWL